MSDNWEFRLAVPDDAPAFAKWAVENKHIDPKDLEAGMHKNNPTVLVFCVTKNGVPVSFAPLYCSMTLAHLGFNPASEADDRKIAMQMLIDGVSAFAVQMGIREITTLSYERYPIGAWALKHGFDIDGRDLFKLDLNKLMAGASAAAQTLQEA